MPLFEYRCSQCGKKSEEIVLAGDTVSAPKCPSCGSRKMTRLLSTFAAHGSSKSEGGDLGDLPCGEDACANADSCGMGEGCGMDGMGGMGGGFGDSDF